MATIQTALSFIEDRVGLIISQSSVYETAPWGNTEQPAFLNQVVEVQTKLRPDEVLQSVLAIETQLGRVRTQHWGARLIDIDILYYDDLTLSTTDLVIPHPHLHNRRFTLAPLAQIAPDFIHPTLKRTNQYLLDNCQDMSELCKMTSYK